MSWKTPRWQNLTGSTLSFFLSIGPCSLHSILPVFSSPSSRDMCSSFVWLCSLSLQIWSCLCQPLYLSYQWREKFSVALIVSIGFIPCGNQGTKAYAQAVLGRNETLVFFLFLLCCINFSSLPQGYSSCLGARHISYNSYQMKKICECCEMYNLLTSQKYRGGHYYSCLIDVCWVSTVYQILLWNSGYKKIDSIKFFSYD